MNISLIKLVKDFLFVGLDFLIRSTIFGNSAANFTAEEFCFSIRSDGSKADLSGAVLDAVKRVRDEVVPKLDTYAQDKECQQAMYDIATELGIDAKLLFSGLYQALINKNQGPRLANFMKIIGKERLSEILKVY